MKETYYIKEFSSQISKLVNQERLLGEEFLYSRVVEKVLASIPENFEHKICFFRRFKGFYRDESSRIGECLASNGAEIDL